MIIKIKLKYMGAPIGSKNAVGNSGGKSLNDRKLAAEVRTMALNEILKVLSVPRDEMEPEEYDLYKAILVKLTGNVLPKLNEVTGEDGEQLVINISREIAEKNEIAISPVE
jgi:hypothetical protein